MIKEDFRRDIAQAGAMACLLEAASPKVGNVNRLYDFTECFLEDFLLSAVAIEKTLGRIRQRTVGEAILEAVTLTRQVTGTNTNLGIVLLMVPLAKAWCQIRVSGGGAPPDNTAEVQALAVELDKVLAALSVADTRLVYQAIRLAAPGGLGHSDKSDVAEENPQITLLQAMGLAAERDLIANEYVNGFHTVLETGTSMLQQGLSNGLPLPRAIAQLHLELLSRQPDTLIVRKAGQSAGIEVMNRAREVWESGGWYTEAGQKKIHILDLWLRQFGNRLNPGTTADIVANVLFVLILAKGPSFWQRLRRAAVVT
ncbi:triphosphoribosyl-dephospho-CoA synthase [Sporomusa sphaeroides]|uniref:triphosphoribosyl-dephospho-CoA synthase n=1 Tax=Sporomusa sphaeroides TaxID=47679 RepID=UPI00202EEE58|nr:triphosphoribosyl-dephospho-CoA synthase [Sporomusa sphaeroides]MCM0759201.1 triphosphoribosyl-dephospho-CoA synthase [Sporomusa sphaeroides DSM 2875]HML35283.1 triphosphoribosyl-dephospho-CoA synthase [Sporomusa sphaeroides]